MYAWKYVMSVCIWIWYECIAKETTTSSVPKIKLSCVFKLSEQGWNVQSLHKHFWNKGTWHAKLHVSCLRLGLKIFLEAIFTQAIIWTPTIELQVLVVDWARTLLFARVNFQTFLFFNPSLFLTSEDIIVCEWYLLCFKH